MITISDILDIQHCDIDFFDHYKEDHPTGNHLYYGELKPLSKITPEIIQDRLNNPEWRDNDMYLIPAYMSYGDYDNSCMVERSNRKIFLEEYREESGVFTISGGYGSAGVAISFKWLLDPANEERAQSIIDLLNALSDYPCIDDEDMSNMEYDAFIESLNDWGIEDTKRALATKHRIIVNDYDQEKLKELILEIDRYGNPVYMIESGGSCYIDIDRMIIPKITKDQFLSTLIDYEEVE